MIKDLVCDIRVDSFIVVFAHGFRLQLQLLLSGYSIEGVTTAAIEALEKWEAATSHPQEPESTDENQPDEN